MILNIIQYSSIHFLWIKCFTLSTLVNSPSFLGPFQMAVSQTLKAQHRYAFWPWYPDEYRWRSHISQVKGHPNYFRTSEVPARTQRCNTGLTAVQHPHIYWYVHHCFVENYLFLNNLQEYTCFDINFVHVCVCVCLKITDLKIGRLFREFWQFRWS